MRVTRLDPQGIEDIESLWRTLEKRVEPSFFLSWAWIGPWFDIAKKGHLPFLLKITNDSGVVVALGLFTGQRRRLFGLPWSRAVYLHETGDRDVDLLTIEYNGLLADNRYSLEAFQACLDYFDKTQTDWDELYFSGFELWPVIDVQPMEWKHIVRRKTACYFVDLEKLRREQSAYQTCLSGNTRYQIRKSLSEYGKLGPVTLKMASTFEEAVYFQSELQRLHQKYWRQKGFIGAFGNKHLEEFHRKLVASSFQTGEVQLLQAAAGDQTIGYLYNFSRNGHVYQYQSGFDYEIIEKYNHPGLVTHTLAIQHYLENGANVYDFLAGNDRYKQSLSTAQSQISWAVYRKPRARFRIEETSRQIKYQLAVYFASLQAALVNVLALLFGSK